MSHLASRTLRKTPQFKYSVIKPTVNFATFKKLDTYGKCVESKKYSMKALLQSIIQTQNTELLQTILDKGFDVNLNYQLNEPTFLLSAITSAKATAIVKMLVQAGANLEATSTVGRTPLLVAAHMGYQDIVETLLEARADMYAFHLRLNRRATALSYLFLRKNPEPLLPLFLAHNLNIHKLYEVEPAGFVQTLIAMRRNNHCEYPGVLETIIQQKNKTFIQEIEALIESHLSRQDPAFEEYPGSNAAQELKQDLKAGVERFDLEQSAPKAKIIGNLEKNHIKVLKL